MTPNDEELLARIHARMGTNSAPAIAESFELMLCVVDEQGFSTLLPYAALRLVGLQPENRLLQGAATPDTLILEFDKATVRLEGYYLDRLLPFLQQHRVRRLEVATHDSGLRYTITALKCGPGI